MRTTKGNAAEFVADLTGEYPEAKLSGFTKVFEGYAEGRTGVVIENRVSKAELAALVEAMTAAGLDEIKLSLRGNLDKATRYTKGA